MDDLERWTQEAAAHRRAGRLMEALTLCRRALSQYPDHPGALHQLGLLYIQQGDYRAAVPSLQTLIARHPDFTEARNNLASALVCLGRYAEAEAALRIVITQKPDFAAAYANLGALLAQTARWEEAAAAFQTAVALQPNSSRAWLNLGLCGKNLCRWAAAAGCFRQVLVLQPASAEALYQLGSCLLSEEQFGAAAAHFEQALRLHPHHIFSLNDLASCRRALGQPQEALRLLDRAIRLEPEQAEVHLNRAHLWLGLGDFALGWPEYEWRFRSPFGPKQLMPCPRWDGGQSIKGKDVFVYGEQGLGDTLQFVRYLPLLRAQGARVVFQSQPELKALLQEKTGADRREAGACDFSVALMSLPACFGTTLASIPAEVPYVHVRREKRAQWRARLDARGVPDNHLRVGLVWAGSRRHQDSPSRSLPLTSFTPLAAVPGVTYFSLQKGTAAADAVPQGMALTDLGAELADFADTAAVIEWLDLVISVDTSVAHLAGALARPVWTLLPHFAEWRWLEGRTDSPWYPTMRLFRQPRHGDWAAMLAEVAQALRDLPPPRRRQPTPEESGVQ